MEYRAPDSSSECKENISIYIWEMYQLMRGCAGDDT